MGSEGAGAEQAFRVDGRQFLDPDSALVRTALDLLATHVLDAEGESTLCAHCGLFYPCPTVQHAQQVVNAGGVARSAEEIGSGGTDSRGADSRGADSADATSDDARFEVRDPVAAV
jgi:hypothetical protein